MDWLTDWAKRIEITIDSTNIDSDLTDFPVLLYLSASSGPSGSDVSAVFDELGSDANRKKIAVTAVVLGTTDVCTEAQTIGQENPTYTGGAFDNVTSGANAVDCWYAYWNSAYRPTGWTGQDFGSGNEKIIYKYRLYVVGGDPTYLPKTWTFEGSNDLSNWDILHSVADADLPTLGDGWHEYECSNETEYRAYRINVTANEGNSTYLVIREIEMFERTEPQCYVEIERWDDANEKAWLWVKVPSVSSTADTTLYVYYDSDQVDNTTYVGDTGDTPAQSVWDSDFKAVYHLAQDPTGGSNCIKDSTSNGNHGTPAGSMTAGDLVDGQIGKALDFDGSDDQVPAGNDASLNPDYITLEGIVKTTGSGSNQAIFSKDASGERVWQFRLDSDGKGRIIVFTDDTTTGQAVTTSALNDGNFHYLAGKWDGSVVAILVGDGSEKNTANFNGTLQGSQVNDAIIGSDERSPAGWFDGVMDEVRMSAVARSDAWLKATYHTCFDNLLTFGPEEQSEAGLTFSGYVYENSVPLSGAQLFAYERATGSYVTSGTSADDGSYSLTVDNDEEHFIVCLDPSEPANYNDLIYGRVTPV